VDRVSATGSEDATDGTIDSRRAPSSGIGSGRGSTPAPSSGERKTPCLSPGMARLSRTSFMSARSRSGSMHRPSYAHDAAASACSIRRPKPSLSSPWR